MTALLAIVPARAGSKGVPGKNRALIGGRPVIDYTIAALEASRVVTDIVLTTDDREILNLYRGRTGVVLVERPAQLATDNATTADTVAHAVEAWKASGRAIPDTLLLAQPTTPLRTEDDVDAAFALFQRGGAQTLVSVCRAEGIRHPDVMYRPAEGQRGTPYVRTPDLGGQRQNQDVVYQRNGAIYIVRTTLFLRTGRLYDADPLIYEMPWERSINIDGPGDMLIARALIESGAFASGRSKS